MSDRVNLKGYFDRIGFAGSIAPSLATLELLHALHPATIPFENLNSLLGLPTPLDLAAIERKLLHERRGGYCYEHNLLFAAVLEELDYSVRRLSARVVWSDPPSVDDDPHHMLLAVDIGGATYIADVGNGGLSLTTPLRLRADVEQTTPHETYRLTGGQPEWQLEVKQADAWRPLYVFELKPRADADFAASNLYLSTHPEAAFRRELRVALSPSGRRLVLRNNRLSTRIEGEPTDVRVLASVAEIREVLTTVFGIQSLPDAAVLDPRLEAIIAAAPAAEG